MSKRGFSLIELMIVVVVFAIVAGMVVINMKGIGRTAEEKLILSEKAKLALIPPLLAYILHFRITGRAFEIAMPL